jgi:hypothetical protein
VSDEKLWRTRFLILSLVRLVGTAVALLGMVVAFGDLLQTGGNRLLGIPLVVIGLIDLAIAPKILSRRWRQQ